MNILYISPFSHGVNISPRLHTASLIANYGNNVHFYTVQTSYVEYKAKKTPVQIIEPPRAVNMHYIKNYYLLQNVAYPFINPVREYRELNKIIEDSDIDILHFYSPEFLTCLPLPKLKSMKSDLPIVLSINGIPGYGWYYGNKLVDTIGKLYSKHVSLRIIKKADLLIPFSLEVSAVLISLGIEEEKISSFIAHGVDIDVFKPATSGTKRTLRAKYDLPLSSFIIMYAGRLVESKRLDTAIISVGELDRRGMRALLLIVGDGPQKAELMSLAKTRYKACVRFIDFVPQTVLSELYACSDMFILLSQGEGISSALLQASASGLPALVTDVGANSDIVQTGVNGVVIQQIESDTINDGIMRIMENTEKLSKNARAMAENTLDWNEVIQKYLHAYEKLLQPSN
jgi:glycosyltransferase involved in cell wall biosynthesis